MNVLKLGKRIETKLEVVERNITSALESAHAKSDHSKQLAEKLSLMEEAVMGRIDEQKTEVEKSLKEQKEVVQLMPKLQSELEKSTQELKKIVEGKDEKEMREVNVIIHNIPECKSSDPTVRKKYDTDSFHNIVCALFGENKRIDADKVYRLGKKRENREGDEDGEPKPRLLLVGLKKKEEVEELMRRRRKLQTW